LHKRNFALIYRTVALVEPFLQSQSSGEGGGWNQFYP
jgi:hypothetical protein